MNEHDNIPAGEPFINATQLKDWGRCSRLWAFHYLLGIASVGDATDFGTLVHTYAEKFLRHRELPIIPGPIHIQRKANGSSVTRFPAAIARKGLHYLPPAGTDGLELETAWAIRDAESGIWFKGTMDFFIPAKTSTPWDVQVETVYEPNPKTGDREPITVTCSLIGDHKTTAGARFALTKEQLPTDVQCLLYAWAVFQRNPTERFVKARWVYYSKSDREPEGWAVDVCLSAEFVAEKFREIILPAARGIVDAATRVAGLPMVDPRHAPEGYPLDATRFKLHVLNQFPYEGHRDDRCTKYGGCWFKGTCFNFDLQAAESKGDALGCCSESCSVGSCSQPETRNPNRRNGAASGAPVATVNPSQTVSRGSITMTTPTVPDAAKTAAATAKIAAEGLNQGWNKFQDPQFAEYVYNSTTDTNHPAYNRGVHVTEYAEKFHQSPAPAINPPMPPAPPAAPMPPAPVATPTAPARKGISPDFPITFALPKPGDATSAADAGESNEQTALYQKLQGRGLIPANRSGRKPGVAKLRAMDAWGWTIDQFAAWETAEKGKGAASTYDATMAAFTATPAANPNPAPVAATPAVNPSPAPVAAPSAPVATSAAPMPPAATPAPSVAPSAPAANGNPARLGFMLAINATFSGSALDFNRDILPQLQTRIRNTDVTMDNGQSRRFDSYASIPFGRGVAMMNAALADYLTSNAANLGAGSVVTIDANTPAGRDALDILRAFAAAEFRGF